MTIIILFIIVNIIVKLYRIEENKDLILINVMSMGMGRISFALPEDEGVKYLLAVEVWKGDVLVDLIYPLIFVPKQYLDTEIYLDKRVYRTGDNLFYTIVKHRERHDYIWSLL